MNILGENHSINLAKLSEFHKRPPLYAAAEDHFWDDPYIAQQMLEAHINPAIDAASRKPETIEATVEWLDKEFLQTLSGNQIIDLGCGPGLYTSKLAQLGYEVSGIDLSKNSILYAKKLAKKLDLSIKYQIGNYLDWRSYQKYDAVTLIFYDYGTFNPLQRRILLENIHEALKPGGLFIFDVVTKNHDYQNDQHCEWSVCEKNGFWMQEGYLSLSNSFRYENASVNLSQHVVINENGETKIYRIWEHWFDPSTISSELEEGGFEMVWVGSDLQGTGFSHDSEGMGIIARKKN
jgi:2-polyprenyl-3-methyl-5-hydroxy-6-metoxy-1,4-benzoquinol methylase